MKQHLQRMLDLSSQLKKFASNKDCYMVENTHFICDQLGFYETHNLEGFRAGGYTFK